MLTPSLTPGRHIGPTRTCNCHIRRTTPSVKRKVASKYLYALGRPISVSDVRINRSGLPEQQYLNAHTQLLLNRKSASNALYKSAILSLGSCQDATEDMRSHSKTLPKGASEVGMTRESTFICDIHQRQRTLQHEYSSFFKPQIKNVLMWSLPDAVKESNKVTLAITTLSRKCFQIKASARIILDSLSQTSKYSSVQNTRSSTPFHDRMR